MGRLHSRTERAGISHPRLSSLATGVRSPLSLCRARTRSQRMLAKAVRRLRASLSAKNSAVSCISS